MLKKNYIDIVMLAFAISTLIPIITRELYKFK